MRSYLVKGTMIKLSSGECFQIISDLPIGEGGGGVIYDALRMYKNDEGYQAGEIRYAIKECYPVSSLYRYERNASGEIISSDDTEESRRYLDSSKKMQLEEMQVTGQIFKKGFRLTPVVAGVNDCQYSFDNGDTFCKVHNTVTVMESLADKGRSLKSYLEGGEKLTLLQAFRTMEQILMAVSEVHQAGYLHLDLQDGNIFIKGQLDNSSDFATLIDFGSARKMEADGYCAPIADKVIFSTEGFTAPEIVFGNDGTLRLGTGADIFSLGYLLLYMILGKKVNPREIYNNESGKFISGFRMKKVKCPKHLEDRLQDILAKMLCRDPGGRYGTIEETLLDIKDFLGALAPYRTDIASVKYDAFICYRHGEIDSDAALRLQNDLEHFRLPKEAGYDKRKIERVFVDEGELSSCADFGRQINEALRNAGWLIVICSPGTKESPWVNLEIDTFLKYHDRNRILAVITEGNPADVFPDKLKRSKADSSDEVLAADARGRNKKEILKNLRKKALPKIAAPMLGTTLETITQRRKAYVLRRILMASSLVIAVLMGFIAYILWQGAQVKEQYRKARENQAKYLAKNALEVYEKGDRTKSLQLSLAIQPGRDEDGPVVPEQLYSLHKALSTYKTGLSADYDPTYIGEAEGVSSGALSPAGTYYLGIDKDGAAVFLDGAKGKLLWRLTGQDLPGEENEKDDLTVRQVIPVSESEALLFTGQTMVCVDLIKKQEKYHVTCEQIPYTEDLYDLHRGQGHVRLAIAKEGLVNVYDLKDGNLLQSFDINKEKYKSHIENSINSIRFNKGGTGLVLGLSYQYFYYTEQGGSNETNAEEYPQLAKAFFKKHSGEGLVGYSLSGKKKTVYSGDMTKKIYITDEGQIAAIHVKEQAEEMLTESFGGWNNQYFWLSVYEPEGKDPVYESSYYSMTSDLCGMNAGIIKTDKGSWPVLYCWFREILLVINMDTMSPYTEVSFNSSIRYAGNYTKRNCLVGLSAGYAQLVGLDSSLSQYRALDVDNRVLDFVYNRKKDTMIQRMSDQLVFSSSMADPGMKVAYLDKNGKSDRQVSDIQYFALNGESYRCVKVKRGGRTNSLLIYKALTGRLLYSFDCEGEEDELYHIGMGEKDHKAYLSFFVGKGADSLDRPFDFYKINISEKKIEIHDEMDHLEEVYYYSDVRYGPGMDYVLMKHENGLVRYDISGAHAVPLGTVIFPFCEVDCFGLAESGRYLVALGKGTGISSDSGTCLLQVYDLEKEEYVSKEKGLADRAYTQLIMGKESDCFAVFDGKGKITRYSCSDGTITGELKLNLKNSPGYASFSFYGGDRMMIAVDGDEISLWDLEKKELMMSSRIEGGGFGNNVAAMPGTDLFTVKDDSVSGVVGEDYGYNKQKLILFSVDESYQFYRICDVEFGYFDFDSKEIAVDESNAIAWSDLYDYKQLKTMALDVLDGKELDETDKKEYFISEDP